MSASSEAQVVTRGRWYREPVELLAGAWRVVRLGGWRLAAVYLVGQLLLAMVAAPVLRWLFAEALRVAGLSGVQAADIGKIVTVPLSAGLILGIVALAFLLLSVQLLVLVTAVQRVREGRRLFTLEWLSQITAVARKLARPGSVALLPYLFLLLPLAGIGFLSVLSKAIAIPSFVSGELMKSVPGVIGYVVFLLVLSTLCVRFALTIPLFVMTEASGSSALRASWRLTRGRDLTLQLAIAIVLFAGAASGVLLVGLGILPVAAADALAPAASPVIAAVMLAIAQVSGMLVVGVGIVLIVAVLVEIAERAQRSQITPLPVTRAQRRRSIPRRVVPVIPIVLMCVMLGTLSILNMPTMNALSRAPETLVLAHRGDTVHAVENTISSLRAAERARADLVEMDVMETADGKFVVMHDANLKRLADLDSHVADLTLDELTALTVHDLAGNSDRVPSLAEYIAVAQEIDQPLLIEIKLHGRERPELVPRLVAELESLGALTQNIYHSLDQASVEELKALRPNLTVGLTMALAGVDVPSTTADFVVIEEWSYRDDMHEAAERAGMGAMVWTVNDEQRMRDLLRSDVDGIITDKSGAAVGHRDDMIRSTGLSDVLFDAIMRYVVIF